MTYTLSHDVEANRIIVEVDGKIMTFPYLEGLSVRHAAYDFLMQNGFQLKRAEDVIAPEISMLPKKLTVIIGGKTDIE
jgi:hypothetical protein